MALFQTTHVAKNLCAAQGHKIGSIQTGVALGPEKIILPKFETLCLACGLSLEKIRGRVRVGNKKGNPNGNSE